MSNHGGDTMTTEAENYRHWHGGMGDKQSPCGFPFPETLGRWTNVREDVTCPACLTAMVEPAGPRVAFARIISGLDAVAATPGPTKENAVEPSEDPTWSPGPPCRACGRPLYLRNIRVADGCPCNSGRGVNHGIVPVLTCTCDVCDPAGTGSTRQPFDVPLPAETPPDAATPPPARPRELTFAEAMGLLAQGQPVECWARSRNEWEPVPPLTGTTLLNVAKVWATQRYRRPEPPPAPAPKPKRVAEMVDAWWKDGDTRSLSRDLFALELCADIAREALACVRRHYETTTMSAREAMDAAEREMLGAEAGK